MVGARCSAFRHPSSVISWHLVPPRSQEAIPRRRLEWDSQHDNLEHREREDRRIEHARLYARCGGRKLPAGFSTPKKTLSLATCCTAQKISRLHNPVLLRSPCRSKATAPTKGPQCQVPVSIITAPPNPQGSSARSAALSSIRVGRSSVAGSDDDARYGDYHDWLVRQRDAAVRLSKSAYDHRARCQQWCRARGF